ncbi:MAG: hypothetical protein ACOCXO_04590 [Bacteroidota bacterium]
MKKCGLVLFVVFIALPFVSKGQDNNNEEKNFGINWSGFVKNDFFFDSRQTVAAREGHFLLFPMPVNEDSDGNDINATGSLNFLSIQSRLSGKITGPDAFGAKTSGMIEGAFFGHSNPDVNGFRLRHAFVKLDWTNTQVLFGQYWHMMFVPECFPGTVSFNTGVPFQYFTRNPQIRLTQKLGETLTFSVAAATQRDFASPGGYASLSNTMTPDMQAQIQFSPNEMFLAGVTGGYKQLLPRLQTDNDYKAENSVGSFTSNAFIRVKTKPLTWKLQGIFAQNAYDGLMIGGFAVSDIVDPVKDYRSYTPVNTLSLWTDIHTNGAKWQTGLFAGYSQNLGTADQIADTVFNSGLHGQYMRGSNIDYLYRVSPRIMYNAGKVRIAGEFEYTAAAYATSDDTGNLTIDEHGRVTDSEIVANSRILLSVYYFF